MIAIAPALSIALSIAAAGERSPRAIGVETTIPYVSGGIRTVRPEGDGSVVLIQDRTLRWYRVTLTGACFADRGGALIVRQANFDNRLDRFARVSNSRFPERVCGITSIVTALAPLSEKSGK